MNVKKAELKDRLQYALDLNEKKAADLAKDLSIPKSAVSQYLSGKSQNMDSARLYSICKYLNVSEPWMLGYDVPIERHLAAIEEKPVETANKLADIFMKMNEDEGMLLEVYRSLDESKKSQIMDFVKFISGKN